MTEAKRLLARWDFNWLLVVLLAVFAVAPLWQPGYFWGANDARHSVYFLVEFNRSIQEGILYPRWSPDFSFGYGYPIFNIYSPLAFYLAEGVYLLTRDFVLAVKATWGLSLILSGLTMYGFARRLLRRPGALLAAVVYIYVPYRLVDVYVRAAFADAFCFVWLPLVLWAFYELVQRPTAGRVIWGGIALAGLVLTHSAMLLLFLPFFVLYLLFLLGWAWRQDREGREGKEGKDGERGLPPPFLSLLSFQPIRKAAFVALALVLAMGLSAVFWLPMVLEYSAVRVDQWTGPAAYDFRNHFIYLHQLLSPSWDYGISVGGPRDAVSFQLGAVPFLLSMLALIPLLYRRPDRPTTTRQAVLIFFALLALLAVTLMLPISLPIWEWLRLASLIQFPFRLLSITTICTSLLAGAVLWTSDRESAELETRPSSPGPESTAPAPSLSWLVAPLLALVILGSYAYLNPPFTAPPEGPVSLAGLMRFQRSSGEMVGLTAWVKEKPTWGPLADLYIQDRPIDTKLAYTSLPKDAQVEILQHTTVLDEIRITSKTGGPITFLTFYYPGWTAYIDGERTPIDLAGELALMTVEVPPGEHVVTLQFENTWPRILGIVITVLTVTGLVFYGAALGVRRWLWA